MVDLSALAVHCFDPRWIRLGNTGGLIIYSVALLAWLARRVSLRMAWLWVVAVIWVGLLTALPKVWLGACHESFWNVHSPSGTASFSTIAYGGAVVVMSATAARWQRILMRIIGAVCIIGIAVSLAVNHMHTPQEVVVGLMIGLSGLWGFAHFYRARTRPSWTLVIVAVVLFIIIAWSPIQRFSLEPFLAQLGLWSRTQAPICTFGL